MPLELQFYFFFLVFDLVQLLFLFLSFKLYQSFDWYNSTDVLDKIKGWSVIMLNLVWNLKLFLLNFLINFLLQLFKMFLQRKLRWRVLLKAIKMMNQVHSRKPRIQCKWAFKDTCFCEKCCDFCCSEHAITTGIYWRFLKTELPLTKVLVIHQVLNLHVSKQSVEIENIYNSDLLLENPVFHDTSIEASISRTCIVMI